MSENQSVAGSSITAGTSQQVSTAGTSNTESSEGRGRSRYYRGRGGRGRGRGQGGRGHSRTGERSTRSTTTTSFKGNTDGMKGNVFQCHGETTDKQQYTRTVGVLGEHINKTFTYPQDVASVCKSFKLEEVKQPDNIDKDVYDKDIGKRLIWEMSMKAYVKRLEMAESNARAIYAIVWGQCSPLMQSKIESLDKYEEKNNGCDCIWLLKEIQGITHKFEGTRNIFISLDDAWTGYYNCRQEKQTLHEYLKDFQGLVQVLEHYGAAIGADAPYQKALRKQIKEDNPGLTTAEYITRTVAMAKKKSVAIGFLKRADQQRYGGLWNELENNFTRGQDQYPADLTSAYNMLLNYKATSTPQHTRRARQREETTTDDLSGVSFLQQGAPVPGANGQLHATITCYRCQGRGHYADQCPTPDDNTDENVQLLQTEDVVDDDNSTRSEHSYVSAFTFTVIHVPRHVSLHQNDNRFCIIPDTWILLDSQSTVSIFKNPLYVSNLRNSVRSLKVHTNGGTQISTKIGTVRNFGDVWFNPNSLANILSMAAVRKICRITMDTSVEAAMHVHRKDGTIMTFKEYRSGLYYYDASTKNSGHNNNLTSTNVDAYLLLNTVAANKASFTQREIEGADRARALYRKLGHPSEQEFSTILKNNLIRNCPITDDDAKRALHIYGPDIATLKGKTVKRQNKGIPNYQPVRIPAPIVAKYRNIRLFMDIFWVNGSPFFHTISQSIKFRTVAPIANRTKRTLLMEAKAVINLYETRGFEISRIEADREFACIANDLLPIPINIADADDHVHEVERSIRTVKERTRCTVQGLPFRRIPKAMMRAAVEGAHKSLNQFPARDGASEVMSPLTIMTGRPNPDYNDLKIEFGAYAQIFESNDPTNTVRNRTTGAIALTPTGNAQGGYYFMSLTTGRKLSRQQWDELPMPDGVIATVEAMAAEQNQAILENGGPFFEWSPGIAILDEEEAPIITDEQQDADAPVPGDAQDEQENTVEENESTGDADTDDEDTDSDVEDKDTVSDDDDDDTDSEVDDETEENNTEYGGTENYDGGAIASDNAEVVANEGDRIEVEDVTEEEDADIVDESTPTTGPRYRLRPNRERTYTHRLAHRMDDPNGPKSYEAQMTQVGEIENTTTLREAVEEMQSSGSRSKVLGYISGFIFTQMTAKAGIKKHGKVAIDALYQEFLQLHDLGVFEGQHANKLSRKQKRAALRAISMIKEKRCGKIKGRTVADGRPQRTMYTKEETSSPTVSTDALMMSIMIDAKEGRDVATADVAGAYLHAELDDFTLLKVEGASVDIMCDVCERYRKFVTYENGKKVLYLRLLKALYGCVKSALLWYELFSGTLQGMGFELNPYDTCVANKMFDGKQCTITWYVDDNKISHVDANVVTKVILKIEERFGKMSVTRGKKHVFLGMEICFRDDGTASICMKDYVKEAISEFEEPISRVAATPAKRDLFEIPETGDLLDNDQGARFHSVAAKLLYVSKRGRLDIQLTVAFLCTRVSCSTKADWAKLKRLLEYLNGSLDEFRVIGADDLEKMMTWVDASYAVHRDMKSHTGGVVSFGTGAIMSKSSKQKLNTKSSTEAELVGASDYLPHAIWAKKFLEGQGYTLKENLFYQDNQSAIRFEKNGRKSCGPNSRHIDIRYFFIKDRLGIEDFEVQHCPTEQMLADFFTKPLQGSLFRRFRAVVMGHKHIDTLQDLATTLTPSQERVGRKVIPRKSGDEDNVRSTVPITNKPVTNNGKLARKGSYTYAEVVKRRPTQGQVSFYV
jgi:hypothetical protein